MECGEQREGLGRHKRAIGLLFLAWLAANLNSHPCRRLRIAQKPRPPASARHSAASSVGAAMTTAVRQQREPCLSYVGAFQSPQRRPRHGRNAPLPAPARSFPRSRIAPATRRWIVCM